MEKAPEEGKLLVRVVEALDGKAFDVAVEAPETAADAERLIEVVSRLAIVVAKEIAAKKFGCGHGLCMMKKMIREAGVVSREEFKEDYAREEEA